MLDEALNAYLPSWLVRLDAPPSSRDPLGLQAHGMEHADRLLPGLNVFTSRARYYTFLCWAIRKAQEDRAPRTHRERVLRLERLLVLTEALRHVDEPRACSYVGRLRGQRFVKEHGASNLWELPTRILKNQGGNGALRLYRTSLEDLGLIEESELEEGLGLELTPLGQQLAGHYKADDGVVDWALAGGTEQRKRADSLLDAGRTLCLSGKVGAHERRHLVARLFGPDGHGVERRETVQVLFEEGLLSPTGSGEDLAEDDADLFGEGDGRLAAQAGTVETGGNWAVLRGALQSSQKRLWDIQVAGAYQILALGLNALFASALRPTTEHGRVPLDDWRKALSGRAGEKFGAGAAAAWAGKRAVVVIADDLLGGERPWVETGMLATELLLRVAREERYRALLQDDPTPIADRTLDWAKEATSASAAELSCRLVEDLTLHHAEVSARKGKGEWLTLEEGQLVRVDSRPLRLGLHALRFPQLQQLAADLRLTPEDVADES